MTDTTQIRRRPDGSIDTAYYMSEGHVCRSKAAHEIAGTATRVRRPIFSLAALVALIPFLGGQS